MHLHRWCAEILTEFINSNKSAREINLKIITVVLETVTELMNEASYSVIELISISIVESIKPSRIILSAYVGIP